MSEEIFLGFTILCLFVLIFALIFNRRSRDYRKTLVDLYVAAKIRQIAIEDKIDLVAEYESFKRFCKKQRIEDMPLDVTIEAELQDKITEDKKK